MKEENLETLQNLVVHNQKKLPCNPTILPYPCLPIYFFGKSVDPSKIQTFLLCVRSHSLASTQGRHLRQLF